MPPHRIHLEASQPLVPGPLEIGGEEAHHAIRVKRVTRGDAIEVLDGRGRVGAGVIKETVKERDAWTLKVEIEAAREEPPARPRVEVLSASPKGPRLSELIDGLSQVGAASWSLLETDRGVSEPGAARLDRLKRIAVEASKQSGRAWHLEIGNPVAFGRAIEPGSGVAIVLADASGGIFKATGAPIVRLLTGPEGGWSERELALARGAGIEVASFGPHIMRIETAAVVAAAVVVDRARAE